MKSHRKCRNILAVILGIATVASLLANATATEAPDVLEYVTQDGDSITWVLKHNEDFNQEFAPPATWEIDNYEERDDIFFDEKGYGIYELWDKVGGQEGITIFENELNSFTAFRQSYTYGESEIVDGVEVPWLTVESYGRGKVGATEPDSGGYIYKNEQGNAVLTCPTPTDAVILRSTNPLPDTYRLEITVKDLNVGGKNYDKETYWEDPHWTQDAWTSDGYMNGYDSDTAMQLRAGPWRPSGDTLDVDDPFAPSYDQNGGYFLSIVDYANPKPHNNLFLHHHRKVAMDFDNNVDFIKGWGGPWSKVWNGTKYVDDGSRYISMLWANGNNPDVSTTHNYLQYLMTGQKFYTFTPDEDQTPRLNTVEMVDKYIPGNEYTFTITRTPKYYEMSVSGEFFYGGKTTYSHRKEHVATIIQDGEVIEVPTWHFNQSVKELKDLGYIPPTENFNLYGEELETWPDNTGYPDYFFTGMPHINYYQGSMTYTNLKLYVPEGCE